jgi:hypothetical protein
MVFCIFSSKARSTHQIGEARVIGSWHGGRSDKLALVVIGAERQVRKQGRRALRIVTPKHVLFYDAAALLRGVLACNLRFASVLAGLCQNKPAS